MNILIITAHPSSKGHTHTIATTYAEARREKKHEVKIVDLYAPEYQTPVLAFENIQDYTHSAVQKTFQEQITWANEIVIIHPIWWSMPPSVMKNWVDLTFWSKFAFKYLPNGNVEKLLIGKTAKIFATAGGPSWLYYLRILPLISFWKTSLFNFCGVSVVDIKICGNINRPEGEEPDLYFKKYLEKVKRSAVEI
jgi:putative NADPH-quinone reductase